MAFILRQITPRDLSSVWGSPRMVLWPTTQRLLQIQFDHVMNRARGGKAIVPQADRAPRPAAEPAAPVSKNAELEQVCARYRRLYSGLIFDVLEKMGLPNQVLSPQITPLTLEMKLAGPAFTVKGTTTPVKNEEWRYRRLSAIKDMTYPCIEVRDRGTTVFNVALYGELTATTARAHGAVGALVDGGTRDSGMIIAMGFPLFARYRTPVEAFGRVMTLEHQIPILVSGGLTETVVVNPGDFIFGDLDGVLVIPKERTMPVLVEAERIAGIENAAREEFKTGADPVEVFKKHQRL